MKEKIRVLSGFNLTRTDFGTDLDSYLFVVPLIFFFISLPIDRYSFFYLIRNVGFILGKLFCAFSVLGVTSRLRNGFRTTLPQIGVLSIGVLLEVGLEVLTSLILIAVVLVVLFPR